MVRALMGLGTTRWEAWQDMRAVGWVGAWRMRAVRGER